MQRVHAKYAIFTGSDWALHEGYTVYYPVDTHFPEMKPFQERDGLIRERPSEFRTLTIQEETMKLRDLRRYIDRNQGSGLDTTGQQVSYHERVALVFTPLILLLLGFPYALKPLNRNQSMPKSIAFCFLVVFLYLLIQRMSLSIGRGGHIAPVVAAWTPNFLFFWVAIFLLTKRT
jgi:lipopolysaccharide export system permease protein